LPPSPPPSPRLPPLPSAAIVEETWRLGGTCVNVGCVPKKVSWHAADIAEKLRQAEAYGFKVPEGADKIDWPMFKEKRDKYIERLNGIYERSASSFPVVCRRCKRQS